MDKVTRLDHRDKFQIGSALGLLVKAEREAAGLSMTALAAQARVSRPNLSRLERGENGNPSFLLVVKLAKCLGITSEDLFALTGIRLETDLPRFHVYIRVKHPGWPKQAIAEITKFCDYLDWKYRTK